jgi:membrane protein implicated in regulation of membrane protease activity
MDASFAIGSLFALLALVLGWGYWQRRGGRKEGATKQEKEDNEKLQKMVKKFTGRAYDGDIGTDSFRVSEEGKWNTSAGTRVGSRLVAYPSNGNKRRNGGRPLPDDKGQKDG